MAQDSLILLFDFTGANAAKQWQAVNDGVMGGVSEGKFKITDEKAMEFFGTLSLANNGGFASVRSKARLRLRRDGRNWLSRRRKPGHNVRPACHRSASPGNRPRTTDVLPQRNSTLTDQCSRAGRERDPRLTQTRINCGRFATRGWRFLETESASLRTTTYEMLTAIQGELCEYV